MYKLTNHGIGESLAMEANNTEEAGERITITEPTPNIDVTTGDKEDLVIVA